jgi:hypothetical protein
MSTSPKPNVTAGLVSGYRMPARPLGIQPEIAILRRFSASNAKNPLYLRADLTALEK